MQCVIFYFDFRTYFRMLGLSFRETNPKGRRRLQFLLFIVIPLVSGLTAVCFLLDRILFPGLWRVRIGAPLFIVGHARSGITLLHRILAEDRERFSFFLFYELFLPSLLQKKFVRLAAACDEKFLGGRIEQRVRAWEAANFGKTQDIHQMGLTLPEEDDFVLTLSCASGWWIVLLPYMDRLDFYHIDERPPRARRRLMRYYAECVKRQLYLNGVDKTHLSKNPTFCGRVGSLIEAFPDARIVYTSRNPLETIPSLLKLLQTGWALRGWTDEDMRRSLRAIAEQSYESYRSPLEVLERHPNTRQACIDYRELVASPAQTVQGLYDRLGLTLSPGFKTLLEQEEARSEQHETGHRYNLDEFGLDPHEIETRLADLFERFDWPRGTSASAPPAP